MFRRSKQTAARIDTLIGRTASVQGDIEFSGGLHIDGRVNGSVRATEGAAAALSVSEHGLVEGSVAAPQVVLNGSVNGDIVATRARGAGRQGAGARQRALWRHRDGAGRRDQRQAGAAQRHDAGDRASCRNP